MESELTILKRKINSSDIELINKLIEKHGKRGRTYISKQLCRIWDWRTYYRHEIVLMETFV
ncbi:MAG TPA: hypothetical protein ENK14_12575, partial [Caldithrix sp.]|nr:hypothetical protein [Caldithrix sp.]